MRRKTSNINVRASQELKELLETITARVSTFTDIKTISVKNKQLLQLPGFSSTTQTWKVIRIGTTPNKKYSYL